MHGSGCQEVLILDSDRCSDDNWYPVMASLACVNGTGTGIKPCFYTSFESGLCLITTA